MEKQFTKGNVEKRGNTIFVCKSYKSLATIHVIKNYKDVTFEPIEDVEGDGNAELIVDAFNTANKTGLFPSEILEQRDELLKACMAALAYHQGGHSEIGAILKQAIKKATNEPAHQ